MLDSTHYSPRVKNMFSFSLNSQATLSTVHIDLQHIFDLAIQRSEIDFGIPPTGGRRTAEEQNALFLGNKSKCDGFIRPSYHQTGRAVDVYAYVGGKASWEEKHLTAISKVVKACADELNIEITWGGDWTGFVDMPHYQLKEFQK